MLQGKQHRLERQNARHDRQTKKPAISIAKRIEDEVLFFQEPGR